LIIGWVRDDNVREQIPEDTPAGISEVIIGCWSKQPEQRLALATVLDKLQTLMEPDITAALKASSGPELSFARSNSTFADNLASMSSSGSRAEKHRASGPWRQPGDITQTKPERVAPASVVSESTKTR